jgi:hypothetical protein
MITSPAILALPMEGPGYVLEPDTTKSQLSVADAESIARKTVQKKRVFGCWHKMLASDELAYDASIIPVSDND